MTVNNMAFTPPTGLLDTTTYPTVPANETVARQQFMDLYYQLRDFLNNTAKPEIDGKVAKAGDTMTGNLTLPALIAIGLTGATAASRYVGATTSGAPTAGAFIKGDYVIDQSGALWICTTAGTPGTWKSPTPPGGVIALSGGVKMQSGLININASGGVTVTFPTAFAAAPIVFVTPSASMTVWANSITATSFFLNSNAAGATNYYWQAIGT